MTLPGPSGATRSLRNHNSNSQAPVTRLRIFLGVTLLSIGLLFITYTSSSSSKDCRNSKKASSSSLSSSSSAGDIDWPLKDKLEYFESVYQESVRRRERELKRRQYGTSKFDPWDGWMSWWSYFPAAFTCPFDIQRVGNFGDGGKWVCGMRLLETAMATTKGSKDPEQQQRPCVVYSLGVAMESSFEEELLKRTNCEIWAFDGSVDAMGQGADSNPRVHFNKVFIGNPNAFDETEDENKEDVDSSKKTKRSDPNTNTSDQQQRQREGQVEAVVPWKSLSTLMEENKHEWIDVLKIDIEGYEYGVLDALLADPHFRQVLPFSQLQIELHLTDPDMSVEEPKSFSRFLNWFQRLESRGLRPFWSELNMIPALMTHFDIEMYYCEFSFLNIRGQHRLVGY
ncbi:hypothetical protein BGZ83_010753 [Gryganskiella cystojenkinii]|nr:hypothetical protein BGZ83_010753 [Gryganskiella cystojenkinii]